MDKNNLKIIKLTENHIKNIENIWIESLPENLKSMIGSYFINKYLIQFFKNKSNLGTGIYNNDKMVGFVLFGNDSKIIRKLVLENYIHIFRSFIFSLFTLNMKKINNFINCFIFILLSKKKDREFKLNSVELIIICISKFQQNLGLGSSLLQNTFQKFKSYFDNYSGTYVKTLSKDYQNIGFYKKNRFIYSNEIFGRTYLKK